MTTQDPDKSSLTNESGRCGHCKAPGTHTPGLGCAKPSAKPYRISVADFAALLRAWRGRPVSDYLDDIAAVTHNDRAAKLIELLRPHGELVLDEAVELKVATVAVWWLDEHPYTPADPPARVRAKELHAKALHEELSQEERVELGQLTKWILDNAHLLEAE